MIKNKLYVVGIMSGTSLDGVDFVLCHIQRSSKNKALKVQFLDRASSNFPASLYQKLQKATKHLMPLDQLSELDFALGQFYAHQLSQHQKQKKWHIDLIGLHGQTVYHHGKHATLQIGKPHFLATQLGVPVASDFRSMDIALGGQGAPLTPFFHKEVLAREAFKRMSRLFKNHPIAIQNIGGIANVTFILNDRTIAYDTGPGNVLIDAFMHKTTQGKTHYDQDGQLAYQGIANISALKKWMQSQWALQKSPKSFDSKLFKNILTSYFKDIQKDSLPDKVATLTELTARTIAYSYKRELPCMPKVIVLCGGGALNKYLIHRIKYNFSSIFEDNAFQGALPEVITSEQLGWPIEAVEGGAFALLAAFCYWNKPVIDAQVEHFHFKKKQPQAILGSLTPSPL